MNKKIIWSTHVTYIKNISLRIEKESFTSQNESCILILYISVSINVLFFLLLINGGKLLAPLSHSNSIQSYFFSIQSYTISIPSHSYFIPSYSSLVPFYSKLCSTFPLLCSILL